MSTHLHRLDVRYAALPEAQIEELWRASQPGQHDLALVRQLVLRALDVIEGACGRYGKAAGFSQDEIERARDEVAIKLFVRLHRDRSIRNVRAFAHALAREVVADPGRRRSPARFRPREHRPRLTLVERKVER